MIDLVSSAATLKETLGLNYEPIAVKFLEKPTNLDGFDLPGRRRYCQVLMGARKGAKLLLAKDNISCPAAAWALGFDSPPLRLSSGEMPAAMGIFGSDVAAKNTLDTMPRLRMGMYNMVAVCPLSIAPYTPDVVVIESLPEHLMWVALANVYNSGGRMQFSTSILQATCVDVTIVPFLTQKLNASLGCYGCREATDMNENECVLGFPVRDLEIIIGSLKKLGEKAIPRVREKPIYGALLSRE